MDRDGVSWHRAGDVKGPGLGIAAKAAADGILVNAAGVDGGGVDGVTGRDGKGR
jgi:hypothetical protein